jgi:hypothetical protein
MLRHFVATMSADYPFVHDLRTVDPEAGADAMTARSTA